MKAVPIFRIDETRARQAFEVHSALLKAERSAPELRHNPQWTIHRQDAFEAFSRAFEALL